MKNLFFIKFLPPFFSFVLILIYTTIAPPQGYSFLTPSISIVCLIYWSLRKKNFHINLLQTFFLGILNDCLLGTPLGGSSLFFILTRFFLLKLQEKLKFTVFISDVITIILSIIFYYLVVYIFIIVYFKAYFDLSYFIMSFLLTISIYPIINTIFNWFFIKIKIEDL